MGKQCKYIFVTGGVLSGVGKGITAASMGAILKAKGFRVTMQKCDPYLNVDAGLLNPVEHGECYVTHDGVETDLDLGHYERFLDFQTSKYSITLSGGIYKELIEKERRGGFRGKTVQLVPHFTNLVMEKIERASAESDVHIVEIGGTVGDYEGLPFIEAIRLFANKVGRENCLYISVVFVPWINTSKELKTKPAQNALKDLRGFGIIPDIVTVRTEKPCSRAICEKIAAFSGIPAEAVLNLPDIESVYDVPENVLKSGVLEILNRFVAQELTAGRTSASADALLAHRVESSARSTTTASLDSIQAESSLSEEERLRKAAQREPDMRRWKEFSRLRNRKWKKTVKVGLVAKYVGNDDTYICVTEALKAAAAWNKVNLELVWINAEELGDNSVRASDNEARIELLKCDGIVVPGGFGNRGVEGKIVAAEYALSHNIPYLGLCLGMQVACIAAARRGGVPEAGTEETSGKKDDVIYIMPEQRGKEQTGASMRLGDYPAVLKAGTETARIYQEGIESIKKHIDGETGGWWGKVLKNGDVEVVERHRHRYEVNQNYLEAISKGGIEVTGTSPDGKLVEFVEAPKCRFFQATQAHPEFRSRPLNVTPLVFGFIDKL